VLGADGFKTTFVFFLSSFFSLFFLISLFSPSPNPLPLEEGPLPLEEGPSLR